MNQPRLTVVFNDGLACHRPHNCTQCCAWWLLHLKTFSRLSKKLDKENLKSVSPCGSLQGNVGGLSLPTALIRFVGNYVAIKPFGCCCLQSAPNEKNGLIELKQHQFNPAESWPRRGLQRKWCAERNTSLTFLYFGFLNKRKFPLIFVI